MPNLPAVLILLTFALVFIMNFWANTRVWMFLMAILAFACQPSGPREQQKSLPAPAAKRLSEQQFGVQVSGLEVIQSNLGEKQYLGDVLRPYAVDQATIESLARQSESVFDVRKMKAGQAFTILKDRNEGVKYFIYEKSKSEMVVFELGDNPRIYETHIPVTYRRKEVAGKIASSLYESIELQGKDTHLALSLEQIFAWTLDFFHLKPGDAYKIVYEEALVNGEVVGIHRILAAWIGHDGNNYFAFGPEGDEQNLFFDENGNSLKKTFLKAPVKMGRSGGGGQPSLKPSHPEKGLMYRLGAGTPVFALADGTVKSVKKTGNTHRVEVSHEDGVVIRLEGFAAEKALKAGQKVLQGQVLGQVARAARGNKHNLAVFYSQNGKSIFPDALPVLPAQTVPEGQMAAFNRFRNEMMSRLTRMRIEPVQAQADTEAR